jgi:hypothetical protein
MTAPESDGLLGGNFCLSRCPEPYWEGMWGQTPTPHSSRVAIPNSLPTRLVGSMDRHACSWCENSPPPRRLLIPLPAQPIPEGSQWLGMGPRNQARWLPPDCPTRRQSGQAIHPTGLRLVRQVSPDSRLASVPAGQVHHCGRRGGLGWKGRQVRLRQAALERLCRLTQ